MCVLHFPLVFSEVCALLSNLLVNSITSLQVLSWRKKIMIDLIWSCLGTSFSYWKMQSSTVRPFCSFHRILFWSGMCHVCVMYRFGYRFVDFSDFLCWSFSFFLPVSEMTYTVSSGTLNSSIPYHTILSFCILCICFSTLTLLVELQEQRLKCKKNSSMTCKDPPLEDPFVICRN